MLTKLWKNYKYRFAPWLLFNIKDELVRASTVSVEGAPLRLEKSLLQLFADFREPNPELSLSVREIDEFRDHDFKICGERNSKILFERWGFNLEIRKSGVGSGNGVFVSEGSVQSGQIVALYPGLLYYPGDPIFFQSFNNSYILRCSDGILIDGNRLGLSRILYKSCLGRDRVGMVTVADLGWIKDYLVSPLNVGQIVNNSSKRFPANVTYHEINLSNVELRLRKFLPNLYYSSVHNYNDPLRIVPLIATKDIPSGEELFSSYFTVEQQKN